MTCPICNAETLGFIGPIDAPILLVGSNPQKEDMAEGMPFRKDYGDILKREIFRLNAFRYEDCRKGYLWLHPKSKECDVAWHLERLLEEVQNHRFVLIMGAEFGNGLVYERSVTVMSGFRHDLGGVPGVICVSPTSSQKEGVGELREALNNFAKLVLEGADVPDDVE